MDNGADTKRVELSGGQWAVIACRPMTGKDLKFKATAAHERGFDDLFLDGCAVAVPFILEWSLGPITLDAVESLPIVDINLLMPDVSTAGKARSASSPAGGSARRASRRSTGGSRA